MTRNPRIDHRLEVRQIVSLGMVLLLVDPLLFSDSPIPRRDSNVSQVQQRRPIRRQAPKAPARNPISRPPVPIAAQVPATLSGQSQTLLPDGRTLLLGGATVNGVTATVALRNSQSSASIPVPSTLRHARAYHTATLLPNGTVLVLGGLDAAGEVADTEIFDPATLTSQLLSSSPFRARAYHTATLLTDGRVMIAGGVGGAGQIVSEAELWDPRSTAVLELPQLSTPRRSHTATLLASGNVALWGGIGDSGPRTDGDLYDPIAGTFAKIDAIPPDPANQGALAGSLPADGATGVATATVIALRFSTPVLVSSANSATVNVTSPNGAIPARIVPAESGRLIFLTAEAGLQPGTTYTVSLQGLLGQNNTPIPSAQITFATAGAAPLAVTGANVSSSDPSDPTSIPALQAPPGVTALSGRVWSTQSSHPLAGITLSATCGNQTTTAQSDQSGLFIISNIAPGHCVLEIDGNSGGNVGREYGLFFDGVDVTAAQTNVLPYTIWMTPLDKGHTVTIPSPTTSETIVSTPLIAGLELHLPQGAVITDYEGNVVTQLSVTAIPLRQPPFPLPDTNVLFYFTIQPGGAYIKTPDGSGARLFYPNVFHSPVGARFDFWNYDPDVRGWYIYGHGSVGADGKQIIPDPGVTIYRLTGAMTGDPGGPPPKGPPPTPPSNPFGPSPPKPIRPQPDPIDPSTGLFVHTKTDLVLPDVMPLTLTRTYRQGDPIVRTFGIGTNLNYDMYMVGDRFPYTYIDLIQADGSRIHFPRISAHTKPPNSDYLDAVFQNSTVPGPYFMAQIVWDSSLGGWSFTLKDGTIMKFAAADLAAPTHYRLGALAFYQDRFGNSITFSRNNCSVPNGYCTLSQVTSSNGRWIKFSYDSTNRMTSAQDNIGRTVRYSYDSGGRLATVTDANGGTTQYTYDSNDQMITITDPRGIPYLTNYYDNQGRAYRQVLGTNGEGGEFDIAYTTDANGNITQTGITAPDGKVETLTFDPSTAYFSGGVMTADLDVSSAHQPGYQYDPSTHLLLSATDSFGRTDTYTYDAKGNIASIAQSPSGLTTTFTWNQAYSQLATASITGGTITRAITYNYDSTGRYLQSIVDPIRTTTVTTNTDGTLASLANALGSVSFTYTGADVTQITTSSSGTTTRVVDGVGRVSSSKDALGNTTYFDYDRLNNLLSITDPLKGLTSFTYDGNGNLQTVTDAAHPTITTTYSYDSMDRLKTRTDPLLRQESYAYYSVGNLHTFTDRKSQTSTFNFDSLSRIIQAAFQDASTIGYTYDSAGRIQQINDSIAGLITRGYDSLDLLTSETTPLGSLGYVNDAIGRRSSMTVTGQPTISYCYDSADRLAQVTQGTCQTPQSPTVSIAYDTAGRRSTLTLPDGIVATYGYDSSTSRLTSINYDKGGTHVGDLSYGYDTIGRRTSLGGTLARVNLPSATTSSAAYNVNNQLTSWNGSTLSYDLNGNMTSDGIRSYTWSARNQLTAIGTTTFAYDALRRRSQNGAGVSFVYDGLNPVQEIVGGSVRANLMTGRLDEYFARTDSGGTSSFITDALGSTLALADSTGAVQTQYAYDPFGNTTSTGASSMNPFQYTSRENDGTGMYYYRARYYNATLQRFISEDPSGFDGGDANFYVYTGNSPTNFVDPLGLDKQKDKCPPRSWYSWLPHGGGLTGGGNLDIGLPPDAPGPGQFGYILAGAFGFGSFVNDRGDVSAASFESGGAAVYLGPAAKDTLAAPKQTQISPWVLGAYLGLGGGGFLTNAQSGNQLKGPFAQWNADIGLGPGYSVSFAWDSSSGIWALSITYGAGAGIAGSALTTTTKAQTTPGSCQ